MSKRQAPSAKRQAPSAKRQAPSAKRQAPSAKRQAPSVPPEVQNDELNIMRPPIPSSYRDYIQENGLFEGLTLDDAHPGYVSLWAMEEIDENNSDIEIGTFAPGFIAFAGNGGGEVLAFDERGCVYMLPLIGMRPEAAIRIADSFHDFASQFVR